MPAALLVGRASGTCLPAAPFLPGGGPSGLRASSGGAGRRFSRVLCAAPAGVVESGQGFGLAHRHGEGGGGGCGYRGRRQGAFAAGSRRSGRCTRRAAGSHIRVLTTLFAFRARPHPQPAEKQGGGNEFGGPSDTDKPFVPSKGITSAGTPFSFSGSLAEQAPVAPACRPQGRFAPDALPPRCRLRACARPARVGRAANTRWAGLAAGARGVARPPLKLAVRPARRG